MSTSDKSHLNPRKRAKPLIAYYNPQYNNTVDFRPPSLPQRSLRDSNIYDVVEPPQRVPLEPPLPTRKAKTPAKARNMCRGLLWVFPLVYTQFWTAAGCAVAQHFFPTLTASKGVEEWKNAYVYTAFTGAMLIASVMADKLMVCMTPAKVFICSQAGIILCIILFGSLHWSPGGDVITGIAISGAAIGGVVLAFYLISMYTITTDCCKNSAGICISVMLCLWKLGYVVGPTLGEALVKLWMYPLPFFVIGGILFFSFLLTAVRGPVPQPHDRRTAIDLSLDEVFAKEDRYRKAFLDSYFLIAMVTAMMSATVVAFTETTLREHLLSYNLTSTDLERTFTVQTACYIIGALTVGVLSFFAMEETCMFFGTAFAVVAYVFAGPVPTIHIGPALWQAYLCQACIGLSTSAMFVASFSHAIERLSDLQYVDTTRTTGFVSSVVFTFLSIGGISIPPLAQYLVHTFGYRLGSVPLLGTLALWLVVLFVMWVWTLRRSCRRGEPMQANP